MTEKTHKEKRLGLIITELHSKRGRQLWMMNPSISDNIDVSQGSLRPPLHKIQKFNGPT